MKKLIAILPLLVAVHVLAQPATSTVYFPLTNWDATLSTNQVKVYPRGPINSVGGFAITGPVKWLTPTNGIATNTMLPGTYACDIYKTPYSNICFIVYTNAGTYNAFQPGVWVSGGNYFVSPYSVTINAGGVGSATNLTPWPSDINAAGFSLTNANSIKASSMTAVSFLGNASTASKPQLTSSQAQAVVGLDGSQNFTVTQIGPGLIGAQPSSAALTNLANGDGSGLTNVSGGQPASMTLSNLSSMRVLNVMKAPYYAIGDASHDDTTAINQAIADAAADPGASVYLPAPPVAYWTTAALNIPGSTNLTIYGDGASVFWPDASATRIWCTSTTDVDGIHGLATSGKLWKNLVIQGIAFTGRTNWGVGVTNAGLRLENVTGGERGPFQMPRIQNVVCSGWANGMKFCDVVSAEIVQSACMYNTNSGIYMQRMDTPNIEACWFGWGYLDTIGQSANDRCTAIINEPSQIAGVTGGSGAGIHIVGCEVGNCYRAGRFDTCDIKWLGGNFESFFSPTEAMLFTNNCGFIHEGPIWTVIRGSNVPIYRLTAGAGNTLASGIKIKVGHLPGTFTPPYVSVEGSVVASPSIDMPTWSGPNSAANPVTMVYKSSIGGSITKSFNGNSAPDVNWPQTWNGQQTFAYTTSGGASAIRVVNGSLAGNIDAGSDNGAATVTANNNKAASMFSLPSFANSSSDTVWDNGPFYYETDGGVNYLHVGGNPAKFGMTHTILSSAAAVGQVASDRWAVFPNGSFAPWLDNTYSIGDLTHRVKDFAMSGNFTNNAGTLSVSGLLSGTNGFSFYSDSNKTSFWQFSTSGLLHSNTVSGASNYLSQGNYAASGNVTASNATFIGQVWYNTNAATMGNGTLSWDVSKKVTIVTTNADVTISLTNVPPANLSGSAILVISNSASSGTANKLTFSGFGCLTNGYPCSSLYFTNLDAKHQSIQITVAFAPGRTNGFAVHTFDP